MDEACDKQGENINMDSNDSENSGPNNEPNNNMAPVTASFSSDPDKLESEHNKDEGQGKISIQDVCRICLCSDRKLHTIGPENLVTFQSVLTRSEEEFKGDHDTLPQRVCWECNAKMNSFSTFRSKALQTNSLLYSFIRPFANDRSDISCIDKIAQEAHCSSLQMNLFQANHADYHFVYCDDHEIIHNTKMNKNLEETNLHYLSLTDDDTHIFNLDIDSSDDNILKKERKKGKKKKKDNVKVMKKDKRCKPANEVLNNDIFNIKDLDQEEQMYEINKRQFSPNYKNSGFKCNECYKGFLDEDAFKGHMIRHTDQCGVYSCAICKIRFKKLQALRNHKTSHMQKFSCKRCNYITFRRHAAKLHEEYHNGTKYVCPHCLENFDKLSTYMSHIRIKHPSDIVCELCGYSFVSDKGLGLHKKLKHRFDDHQVPTDGPWCTKCDVQFINKEALERHMQLSTKHGDEMKSSKPHVRRHCRDQDSSKSHNDSEVKKKRNTCKPEGPIACEQCDMQLPDPLSYYRHFRRVHPYKNRTNYPSMKSKSMCEVCGKMFQSLALLQDHSWTHTDSKQFKCSACDKQFVRKYRLIAHQRVHGATRGNHTCSVCSKSFTTASNMHRHMVSHTGLKPFKCEMCDKCFKHVSEKRVHVTYVHLKKPWPKRTRGKRKDSRQSQPQLTPMPVSNIQPMQIDARIENKPMYCNIKM